MAKKKKKFIYVDCMWFYLSNIYSVGYGEMITLGLLDALSKGKGYSTASNHYIATMLNIQEDTARKYLQKLRKLGLIDWIVDGKIRKIEVKKGEFYNELEKEYNEAVEKEK